VVAADAEDQPEALLAEPFVERRDTAVVTPVTEGDVAAVDQHIARQPPELAVPAVGITDDDELHGGAGLFRGGDKCARSLGGGIAHRNVI
jgi:hypothetical protein